MLQTRISCCTPLYSQYNFDNKAKKKDKNITKKNSYTSYKKSILSTNTMIKSEITSFHCNNLYVIDSS